MNGSVSELVNKLREKNEGKVYFEEDVTSNIEKGLRSVGVPFDVGGIAVVLNVDVELDSISYFTRKVSGVEQVNAMVLCSN